MTFFEDDSITIYNGDALRILGELEPDSIHCCVTSPPYWGLRDYGVAGQIGLEETPAEYIENLVNVFRAVRRVLVPSGTLWLNMGDTYAGSWGAQSKGDLLSQRGHTGDKNRGKHAHIAARQIGAAPKRNPASFRRDRAKVGGIRHKNIATLKPKDLCMMPARLAIALQDDGWWLRSDIIWHKPNPMPENVTDRPTKAHEYLFLLAKSEEYFYNANAIAETVEAAKLHGTITPSNWHQGNQEAERGFLSADAKNNEPSSPDSTKRMSENTAAARRDGAPHDMPFGEKRNKRSVWTINTEPYPDAHFATFPQSLVRPCILAGAPPCGIVLDPFGGSGTTALVARKLGCKAVLIELNIAYCELAVKRLRQSVLPLV